MRNNKAFTLVELLAVVIILSVLLGIAVPSYNYYMKTTKERAFTKAEESMKNATNDFFAQCASLPFGDVKNFCDAYPIPSNSTETVKIKLSDLVKYNYLDPIADPDDSSKSCDLQNSYVSVTNKVDSETHDNNDLDFKICLICSKKKSSACH